MIYKYLFMGVRGFCSIKGLSARIFGKSKKGRERWLFFSADLALKAWWIQKLIKRRFKLC